VEQFALQALLPALVDTHPDEVVAQLAAYIGTSPQWVEELNARVPVALYVKHLLFGSHRLLSVYDASWTAIDPDPASPLPPEEDPLLVRINLLLTPAFNHYIRETLGFETDMRYNILNKAVSKEWNWASGLKSQQGFVGAAEDL
jgi:carboxypeptidase C (cathepsin A)